MKDKHTYDLIEGLCDIENLDFNFNDFTKDEDISLSSKDINSEDMDLENIDNEYIDLNNIDINKIKKRTYEKIGKSKIRKYKNKKILSMVASIALVLIIGTPVALAIVDKLYKYDPSSGSIIKSEKPLYILKNPITKKVRDGEITLTSFVAYPEEERIEINELGEKLSGFKFIKREIRVNGEEVLKDTYTRVNDSGWDMGMATYIKYKAGDEILYTIKLKDKENNITKVDFNVNLEEATSVEEYNRNGVKDTKNNVTLSTITREEKDTLYAELMAIPSIDNINFRVNHYGNHINENKGSNIFLVDSNGKKVEGEYVLDNNKMNEFKFDISNMKKPFTIEVKDINVSNEINKGVKVKLPKLKFGESLDINKEFDLEIKDNELTKYSNTVKINKVERKQIDRVDTYKVDIEYPDNEDYPIKLTSLGIEPKISMFGMGKFNFTSSSQDSLEDETHKSIKIYLENYSEIDFKKREKARGVEFKMIADSYIIQGPWKLNVK